MGEPAIGSVIAFTWLALAMTLAPGADTILVLRSSLAGGWRSGVLAALGIVTGVVVWGGLAGLGVALLLTRFPVAYLIVAIAGGLYLIVLAAMSFASAWRTWRSGGTDADDALAGPAPRRSPAGAFWTGLLTNLLNPKIGVFYLSVMPGLFIGQGLTVWLGLLLGGIHALWGMLWLSALALLTGWARRFLLRPRVRAVLDAVCGLCLLAFGAIVLIEVLALPR